MQNNILIFMAIMINIIFCQCEDYNQSQCGDFDECEWIEDVSNWNCSNFGNSDTCENYSDYGCSWEFSWGGWQNYGSSCVGGSFQIDNGYCQEIFMPECSEYLTESNCNHSDHCEWLEDIQTESCNNINTEQNCEDYPGECFWNEDVEWFSCSGYSNESSCNSADGNCYWDCSWWYTWACSCYGGGYVDQSECLGEYEVDYGICEEIEFFLGDVNSDGIFNIQDIIQVIDIILNNLYNDLADMNSDGVVNVIDVLQIVNIILGGNR